MKFYKNLLSVLLVLAFVISMNAAEIRVIQGKGYSNMVWYNLVDDQMSSADWKKWDIMFLVKGQNAAILINDAANVQLWEVVGSKIEDYGKDIDTTGLITNQDKFKEWHNSDSTWAIGAFNCGLNGFDGHGDFGWGVYNMATHSISGTKIFIIKDVNGIYYQIKIDDLAGGSFYFEYKSLDGKIEQSIEFKKSSVSPKTFGYFSLSNPDATFNFEPDNWSLVFGKYIGQVRDLEGNIEPYPVNGIRHAAGYRSVLVQTDEPTTEKAPTELSLYSPKITTIGHEWKKLNSSMQWEIPNDRVYFVFTPDKEVYRLVFKAFTGSSSGEITFDKTKEDVVVVSVDEKSNFTFALTPNVLSSGQPINLVYSADKNITGNIDIIDILGNKFYSTTTDFNSTNYLNLNPILPKGMYFVKVTINGTPQVLKLIVQ